MQNPLEFLNPPLKRTFLGWLLCDCVITVIVIIFAFYFIACLVFIA